MVESGLRLEGGTEAEQQKFAAVVQQWPELIRRQIKEQNIRFIKGAVPLRQTSFKPKNNTVDVYTQLFDKQGYIQGTLLWDSIICAYADDLPAIDWQRASEELVAFADTRQIQVTRRQLDPGTLLLNVHENIGQKGKEFFRSHCPYLTEIYEAINKAMETNAEKIPAPRVPKIPVLENATEQEQKLFSEAFKNLPDYARRIILERGIQFSINHNISMPRIEKDKVVFEKDCFEDRETAEADLFGTGLAAAVKINVEPSLLKNGAKEYSNGMSAVMSSDDPLFSKSPRELRQAVLSLEKKYVVSKILGTAYAALQDKKKPGEASQKLLDMYAGAAKIQNGESPFLTTEDNGSKAKLAELRERYQASDTAFAINNEPGALTEPQKQYFHKLNDVIGILGVSPKEFDDQFKFSALKLIILASQESMVATIDKYHSVHTKNNWKEIASIHKDKEWNTKYTLPLSYVPNRKKSYTQSFERQLIGNIIANRLQFHAEKYADKLGIASYISPPIKDPDEPGIHIIYNSTPKIAEIFGPPDHNSILQQYAAGVIKIDEGFCKNQQLNDAVGTTIFSSQEAYFRSAIIESVTNILYTKNEEIKGTTSAEQVDRLNKLLHEMDALWPQVVMSQKELDAVKSQGTKREQQIALKRQQEEAAQANATREAEERKHREAEEAKKPKPYLPPASLAKNGNGIGEEIRAICGAMDCRIDAHKALGDALFNPPVKAILDALALGQHGSLMKALNVAHNSSVNSALENARQKLAAVLNLSEQDVPEDQRTQAEVLKKQLMESPLVLAILTGRNKWIEAAKSWIGEGVEEKRLFIENIDGNDGLLIALGLVAAPEIPVKAIISPSAPPPAPPAAPTEIPITPLAGPVAVTVIAPVVEPPPSLPVTPLVVEKPDKRKAAYDAAYSEMLADIEMHVLAMADKGYMRFKCDIGLKENGYPIKLVFANTEGEKEEYFLKNHAKQFEKCGLSLGLDDAMELVMAAHNFIFNYDESIEILRTIGKNGQPLIELHDQIPRFSNDPKHRQLRAVSANGLVALQIEAPDRIKKDGTPKGLFKVTFQLGVPDTTESLDENPEVAARTQVILDYIAVNPHATKQQVTDHLHNWVLDNGKDWIVCDHEELPGFGKSVPLHEVRGENPQRITMGSIGLQLDQGGVNPTWKLKFKISVNGKDFKNSSLILHTTDIGLAQIRAKKSLENFQNQVRTYCAEHPYDPWVKQGLFVGPKEFTDFEDDMPRYEHTMKMKEAKRETQDDKVMLTLQLVRGVHSHVTDRNDMQDKEEPMRYSLHGKRKPVEITLRIPKQDEGKIDSFISAMNDNATDAISKQFAPFSWDKNAPDKPMHRKPVPNFQPNTIKNFFARAIETEFGRHFGVKLNHKTLFPREVPSHIQATRPQDDSPSAAVGV